MNYSVREKEKRKWEGFRRAPLFKTMQMVTHSGRIDTFIAFEEGLPFGVVVFILGPFSLLQLLSLSLQ